MVFATVRVKYDVPRRDYSLKYRNDCREVDSVSGRRCHGDANNGGNLIQSSNNYGTIVQASFVWWLRGETTWEIDQGVRAFPAITAHKRYAKSEPVCRMKKSGSE